MYKMVINGELYHHGVLGQKWGVRRFQNADGSLTAKGVTHSKSLKRKLEKANKNEDKFKAKDAFLARKILKKNKKLNIEKENYNKVSEKYGKKLFEAELRDDNNGTSTSRNVYYEGHKAVREALLKDAGFSDKKAKAGAEWLTKHNWNISVSDMFKINDISRDHWNNYDY